LHYLEVFAPEPKKW